jgi:hypothetical protein
MSTKKQIIYLDASTLKSSACMKYLYLHNIKGLKSRATGKNDFKMHYGTAVHAALGSPFNEVTGPHKHGYYSGESIRSCLEKALNLYRPYEEDALMSKWSSWQHSEHLRQTLTLYFELNHLGADGIEPLKDSKGNAILEQKFAIPVWSNDNYEIALSGIIDMRCLYFGQHVIMDHKTHGVTFFDGADPVKKFFNQYKMDVQTMFYVWIDKMANKRQDYLPIVINGIFLKKPTEKALKQRIFDGAIIERSRAIQYDEGQMRRFELWIERKLSTICSHLNSPNPEESFFADDERSVCSNYGGCKFFNTCELGDLISQRMSLDTEFDSVEYNPLLWRD